MKKNVTIFLFLTFVSTLSQAQNESKPFEKVFGVIASSDIFKLSSERLMEKLDGLCKPSTRTGKEQYKFGNTECVKEVDVQKFTISSDRNIGMISVSFTGIDKCTYIKKELMKNFGKPSVITNECTLDWKLKSSKKGGALRYVGFETSKEDGLIYFSIGEEQGP